jgi:hypothetical protein
MSQAPAPPPHVTAAASVVETYLREQSASPKSADEIRKMSPRDRIDYCRRFDQSTMPAWKDPRAA